MYLTDMQTRKTILNSNTVDHDTKKIFNQKSKRFNIVFYIYKPKFYSVFSLCLQSL